MSQEFELPELPVTYYNGCGDGSVPLYTDETMHDYALAAVEKYRAEQAQQSATVSSDKAFRTRWQKITDDGYNNTQKAAMASWNAALQYAATKGKEKEQEDDYVIKRLSGILAEISIALKGEELPLHSHGYHDLVELTQTNVLAIELYKHENTQRSERDKAVDEVVSIIGEIKFSSCDQEIDEKIAAFDQIRKIWRGEK